MIFKIASLLDKTQTAAAREFINRATFISGSATNPGSKVKNNQQVDQSTGQGADTSGMIVQALFNNAIVAQNAMPRAIPAPTFSRYLPGMYYGLHMDEAAMSTKPSPLRTDVSVTVFLSSPDEYEGGELEIWIGSERITVKLDAGDAVIYPTGVFHQVHPVKSGVRHAAVTWIQSYVPQLRHRQVLSHLNQLMEHMDDHADETDRVLMQSVRTSLYRMWMEL